MKKAFQLIYDRIKFACVLFAIFVFALTVFAEVTLEQVSYIASYNLLVLFAFSLAVSFVNLVFKVKKLSFQIRYMLHALMMFIALSLLFYFNGMTASGSHMTPQTLIVILVTVAIIYAVIDLGILISRLFVRSKGNEEYTPMFKDKN